MPRHAGEPQREPRTEVLPIDRDDQIAVLASPVRQEIMNVTSLAGPCTVADLGRILGRAPDSLYYHVKKLLDVGLLVGAGTRGRGEALYDTPARRLRLAFDPANEKRRGLILDAARASLRAAQRDLERSLGEGGVPGEGPRQHTGMGRVRGWLTDDELAEVNRLIARLTDLYYGAVPRPGTQLSSLTYAVARVEPSARAPESRGEDADLNGG